MWKCSATISEMLYEDFYFFLIVWDLVIDLFWC